MENLTFVAENPRRRKSKKHKGFVVRKKTKRIKSYSKPKRRRRLHGAASVSAPMTQGRRKHRRKARKVYTPIQGRKRRSSVHGGKKRRSARKPSQMLYGGKKRRAMYGGRKRHHSRKGGMLGSFNFGGIFDELLSYGQMAIGGIGGAVASYYVANFIKEKGTTSNPTYGDFVLGGGLSFIGLQLVEDWMRPSGFVKNLFTGAKFTSVLTAVLKLWDIFVEKKEWGTVIEGNYVEDTSLINKTKYSLSGSGLGTSYYIDDTGETFALGATKFQPRTTMGSPKMFYGGASDPDTINQEIDSLMSGAKSSAPVSNAGWGTFR